MTQKVGRQSRLLCEKLYHFTTQIIFFLQGLESHAALGHHAHSLASNALQGALVVAGFPATHPIETISISGVLFFTSRDHIRAIVRI